MSLVLVQSKSKWMSKLQKDERWFDCSISGPIAVSNRREVNQIKGDKCYMILEIFYLVLKSEFSSPCSSRSSFYLGLATSHFLLSFRRDCDCSNCLTQTLCLNRQALSMSFQIHPNFIILKVWSKRSPWFEPQQLFHSPCNITLKWTWQP